MIDSTLSIIKKRRVLLKLPAATSRIAGWISASVPPAFPRDGTTSRRRSGYSPREGFAAGFARQYIHGGGASCRGYQACSLRILGPRFWLIAAFQVDSPS